MPPKNPSAKYSRHGSKLIQDKFRVYHQGGLDAYCQIYSIFNLINFLYFKQKESDFIGKNYFETFLAIRDLPSFKCFFPETPFGDENGTDIEGALCIALQKAKLKCKIQTEEDESIPSDDPRQCFGFRIGIEGAFDSPNDVLGLTQVHEDEDDISIGHCVVIIGKSHLEATKLNSKDWDGIVLDSDRDYVYWKRNNDNPKKPYIEIARSDGKPLPIYWISRRSQKRKLQQSPPRVRDLGEQARRYSLGGFGGDIRPNFGKVGFRLVG
jgi:hypothetical protein